MFQMIPARMRRLFMTPLAVAASLTLGACDDDPVEIEEEPDVQQLRIQVAAQTVMVNVLSGAVTGGPIRLTAGIPAAVSVQFLGANGTPDPLVTASDFRLDVTSSTPTVTFARQSAFAGTLTGTQSGSVGTVKFSLFHLGEQHTELDREVAVQVN